MVIENGRPVSTGEYLDLPLIICLFIFLILYEFLGIQGSLLVQTGWDLQFGVYGSLTNHCGLSCLIYIPSTTLAFFLLLDIELWDMEKWQVKYFRKH